MNWGKSHARSDKARLGWMTSLKLLPTYCFWRLTAKASKGNGRRRLRFTKACKVTESMRKCPWMVHGGNEEREYTPTMPWEFAANISDCSREPNHFGQKGYEKSR